MNKANTSLNGVLLEYHNRIVEQTVKDRIENPSSDNIDVTCADFDGVSFHVTATQDEPNMLTVSISTRCFATLQQYGVEERLKKVYGPLSVAAESSYDATLKIDVTKAPKEPGFYRKIAMLKRHVLSAPFYHMFEKIDKKEKSDIVEVRYRAEEAFYLKPEGNGCTVIFSIWFRDVDDIVFSKVFLQEFADARKTIRGAPSVTFSQKEPPMELANVSNVVTSDQQGFVSFALFPDHIHAQKRDRTISQILTFRDYLHYHLKCSKAYMHQRMRARVDLLLQVLNRAKQPKPEEEQAKKKTMAGKTFVRK